MARYDFVTDGDYVNFKDGINTLTRLHNSSRCIEWLYDDTSGIKFRVAEFEIQTDNMANISFDGDACSTQADFQTGVEDLFPGYTASEGEEGGSSYLVASVELTDAEIKVSPSTEYTIQAAPGAGKYLAPQYVSVILDNTAGAYVTGGQVAMEIKVGSTTFGVSLEGAAFEDNSNIWLWAINSSDSSGEPINVTALENLPIKLVTTDFNTDPFTGGNAANTLKVTVYYVAVDL